jgi:hypothetical protein
LSTKPDIIPDGLPDHLPEGERLIWQGKPEWKRLAIDAFHVRKVAAYFAVLIVGQGAWKLADGATLASALEAVPMMLALGCLACAILLGFAYASARTTHYTLTSKRVLMKVGIALPVIINLPLRQIDGVSFALTGNGSGTICFRLGGNTRLAYLLLWPHAKPWNFNHPQPAFRDVTNVEAVASRIAFAMGGQMPRVEAQAPIPHGQLVAAE